MRTNALKVGIDAKLEAITVSSALHQAKIDAATELQRVKATLQEQARKEADALKEELAAAKARADEAERGLSGKPKPTSACLEVLNHRDDFCDRSPFLMCRSKDPRDHTQEGPEGSQGEREEGPRG